MSLRIMLDTSLSMSLLSDRPTALRDRLNAEAGSLALSSIALMELLCAANEAPDHGASRRAVEDFASRFKIVGFDSHASQIAADLEAELGRAGGSKIGYDLLVAAHARSLGLTLATDDPSRFVAVRGLAVENWAVEGSSAREHTE